MRHLALSGVKSFVYQTVMGEMIVRQSTYSNLIGRFAIVRLWPNTNNAEVECIHRIQSSAKSLGLECVEIYADGTFIADSARKVSRNNVDFVIHLHYDTPKNYDAFSFAALWNPLDFYYQWGYSRCCQNLLSHDDFISCNSDVVDAQIERISRRDKVHLPPMFRMFHSVAGIVYPPTIGNGNLFYIGINWEALGKKTRHQEIFEQLDSENILDIYGPQIFRGVRVWDGYKSYRGEIPFDGESVLKEIAKSSAALVLSSQAHRNSNLMSNRLFETIASGTMAICDENNFAKKYFGDTLLYVDCRDSTYKIIQDIKKHLEWIRSNPEQVLRMISEAQNVFTKDFSLNKSISEIYNGLAMRKNQLKQMIMPGTVDGPTVAVYGLLPSFSLKAFSSLVDSLNAQEYTNMVCAIVVDKSAIKKFSLDMDDLMRSSRVKIKITDVDYYSCYCDNNLKTHRPLGEIILELLEDAKHSDACVFVAPNEKLLSNHISTLAGVLHGDSGLNCVASSFLIYDGKENTRDAHSAIDVFSYNCNNSLGFGRFMFRTSSIRDDIHCAMKFIHSRPLAVLIGDNDVNVVPLATVTRCDTIEFMNQSIAVENENLILNEYLNNPNIVNIVQDVFKNSRASPSNIHCSVPNCNYVTISGLFRRLTNYEWVKEQIQAVSRDGVRARFSLLLSRLRVGFVRFGS